MFCCCFSRGGRLVLRNICNTDSSAAEERIVLLTLDLEREKTNQKREIACSMLPQFPTFIIDLILEFEAPTGAENFENAEKEKRFVHVEVWQSFLS